MYKVKTKRPVQLIEIAENGDHLFKFTDVSWVSSRGPLDYVWLCGWNTPRDSNGLIKLSIGATGFVEYRIDQDHSLYWFVKE